MTIHNGKMTPYESVTTDPAITQIYDQITAIELEQHETAHHGMPHILRVTKRTAQLLHGVHAGGTLIEEACLAAYLHDVGKLQGKKDHAARSYQFAKAYFKEHGILLTHEKDVLEAIKEHSNGFDAENPIARALILADKLDISYERLTPYALMETGIRQMRHIRSVRTEIAYGTKPMLHVTLECAPEIDLEELRDYPFLRKVERAIDAFADYFFLTADVAYLMA